MQRPLIVLGVLAGATGACDPGVIDAPAVREAPLEASGQQFQVQGDIRVSTCTVTDGVTTTTPRAVSSLAFVARGNATATCKDDQGQPLTGQALTDCTSLVAALRSTPVLNTGTAAAGDESYTMAPQQWIIDDSTNPVTRAPVSYSLAYVSGSLRGPLLELQANTRYLFLRQPVSIFTAPLTDGGTVNMPIISENMASYRLRLQYTPTIRDGTGQLQASDRIIGVTAIVSLRNASDTRWVVHDFDHVCTGGNCANDARPLDPNGAAALSRFLNAPAVDGAQLVPPQAVTPQEIIFELPITPNSTGTYSGDTYTLSIDVLFADGIRSVLTPSFQPSTVAPCAVVDQTHAFVRPPTRIQGSILLNPDLSDFPSSPVAQSYAPTVRQQDANGDGLGYFAVNLNNDPSYTAPASPTQAVAFDYRGPPPGTYRIESPLDSSSNVALLHGHARLTYPGFSPLSWGNGAYRAVFRFPTIGSYESDGVFTVTEADVDLDGQADSPVTLNISADMAYLEGNVTLAGCPPDVMAAAADITGAASGGVSEYTRGFSRGLFAPFARDTDTTTGDYLIAAIAGDWVETRYLFDIGGSNQQGFLWIDPAPTQAYTLAAGGLPAERTRAPARAYAMSKATLTLAARDGNNALVPSRNPILEISGIAPAQTFRDPGTGAALGKYYAAAQRNDDAVNDIHTLEIYAPSTWDDPATPARENVVLVKPSVEVQSGNGWSRTTFPAIEVEMTSALGEGCSDTCVDSASTPPATYTDDGQAPIVAAPGSLTFVEGTTTTTVTVTATDHLELTSVTANGIPMTRIPNTDQYTVDVPLTPATTAITIVAQDQCRKQTTQSIAVVFTADVCLLPAYDICTEEAPGSVFHVELLNADGESCQLPCAIAGPDQAVTCDPAAITCAN